MKPATVGEPSTMVAFCLAEHKLQLHTQMKKYPYTSVKNWLFTCLSIVLWACGPSDQSKSTGAVHQQQDSTAASQQENTIATLDTVAYNRLMQSLANGDTTGKWPVKGAYPRPGAILPFNRVVAFYGNLFSTRMGILGELPENQMLDKLQGEVKRWQAADTTVPVIPALHYIATTAQLSPGKEGKYTLRMPHAQIDTILRMAKKIDALVFVDLQIGLSNLQREVPMLEKYLSMPNVHLGIDPEFSMKSGRRPGSEIGSFNADDINYTTQYLAELVKKHNLPPKMLVVHRFTQNMVQQYQNIQTLPEVQIIIDMDGWGAAARKINTYQQFTYKEPVQFTGFKIFYKNDLKEGGATVMKPQDVLKLVPRPSYIQYQ